MIYIFIGVILILTTLMCLQESKTRKINFYVALLICIIVTPFFGYFIVTGRPLRTPKGCKWCSNKSNEAEYCGLCGKNELGDQRKN